MRRFLAIFLGITCIAILFVFSNRWQTILRIRILVRDHPEWMLKQINEDLAHLDTQALSPSFLDQICAQHGERSYGRYRITNHKLEASFFGPQNDWGYGRFVALTDCLRQFVKVVSLPDLDFLVSMDDACDGANLPAPVCAFAKNTSLKEPVILIPDWEILEGNEDYLKGVKKGASLYPWHKRTSKAVWRGRTLGAYFSPEEFLYLPRSQLVSLSITHPGLIDAKFSFLCQCSDPETVRNSFQNYFDRNRSIRWHLQYKYQILIDGTTSAYSRTHWQLLSHSLIFKVDSSNIQWYTHALQPNVHYIPVKPDLQDLVEKIQWAVSHDQEAKKISERAFHFAKTHLQRSSPYLYLYLLLQEYAKKQAL